jgi:hypothetical protein
MDLSRRGFLKGSAAATAGLVTAPLAAEMLNGQKHEAVGHGIAALFDTLPGEKALNEFRRILSLCDFIYLVPCRWA